MFDERAGDVNHAVSPEAEPYDGTNDNSAMNGTESAKRAGEACENRASIRPKIETERD